MAAIGDTADTCFEIPGPGLGRGGRPAKGRPQHQGNAVWLTHEWLTRGRQLSTLEWLLVSSIFQVDVKPLMVYFKLM